MLKTKVYFPDLTSNSFYCTGYKAVCKELQTYLCTIGLLTNKPWLNSELTLKSFRHSISKIVRMFKKQSRITCKDLVKDLQTPGTGVISQAVNDMLWKYGLRSCRVWKVLLLKKSHMVAHLKFNLLEWYSLVWCDQDGIIWPQFTLSNLEEEVKPEITTTLIVKNGGNNEMVWDYFSFHV